MESFLDKIAEGIVARLTGAMSFRFMVQPLVAIILGIRDGIMDAKAGVPPIIVNLIFNAENRKAHLGSALKSLTKPVIVGTVLDMIAQYLIFQHVRVIPAFIVGAFVMAVPYALARGISNRIVTLKNQK
jgi:hypothetical protein